MLGSSSHDSNNFLLDKEVEKVKEPVKAEPVVEEPQPMEAEEEVPKEEPPKEIKEVKACNQTLGIILFNYFVVGMGHAVWFFCHLLLWLSKNALVTKWLIT